MTVSLVPPGRTLVLVAGMPGAGKSTLLAGLPPRPDVRVLDSDGPRAALARLLPGVPYAVYRPLVHLWHRLAVLVAAFSGVAAVVVHLPATDPRMRAAVARLAGLSGRSAHLVWVHVDPAAARRGQHERGRVVPAASFGGHAARAVAAEAALRAGRAPGFVSVTVLDRGVGAARSVGVSR